MASNAIDARLKEKIEILAGDRPRNRDDAAVRVKDLQQYLDDLEARILDKIKGQTP